MKKIKGTRQDEFLVGTDKCDWIEGKGGNDTLYGLAGDDTLKGGVGNDRLIGGGGDDTLKGGHGWDIASFSDDSRNYDFAYSHGRWTVAHDRGTAADGTDKLKNIEELSFADGTVYLDGRNNAPIAAADAATAGEDGPPVVVDLLANDWDFEGDPLTVTALDTTATIGTVTLNSDGTATYDPDGQFEYLGDNETATASFAYTVSDGDLADTATATVVIQGQNDAPHSLTLSKHCVEPDIPGAVFGTLSVVDPDLTDVHHYTLLSPDDRFEIVGDTLKLKDGFSLGPAEVVRLDIQGEDAAGAETHSEMDVVGVRGPQGTDGNDTLFGIDGQNAICAGAGDDRVYLSERGVDPDRSWVFGEGGNDGLYGGREDDHLYGGEGNDTIYGWGGDDYLDGGSGNDYLAGGYGVDTLIGGSGSDTLFRVGGPDELFGGEGNDTLVGWHTGQGYLTGGSGQDIFKVYHEYYISSTDFVLDFATGPAGDVLDYVEYLSWYSFPSDVNPFSAGFLKFEDFGEGSISLVAYPSDIAPVTNIVLVGVEPGSINSGNLFPVFDPWAIPEDQVIVGTDENNSSPGLHGDGGNDTIIGLGGHDALYGWLGDDLLQGGEGNDYLWGGEGNDILEGGAGNDHLFGNSGVDIFRFEGAFGSDYIGDLNAGFDQISISADLAADFPSLDTNGNEVLDSGDAGIDVTGGWTVITLGTSMIRIWGQMHLEADDFVFG